MSRYRYKSKKGNFLTQVPIWVWCVGVLSVYFALWEGKIIEFPDATDEGVNAGRPDSETGQDLRAALKSKY